MDDEHPTREEIARAKAAIQAKWSPRVRKRRNAEPSRKPLEIATGVTFGVFSGRVSRKIASD